MSYSGTINGHGVDPDAAKEAWEDFVHALRAATSETGVPPSGSFNISEGIPAAGSANIAQDLEFTDEDRAGGFGGPVAPAKKKGKK